MTFQERLRSIEERYDINESEHAQELGRIVAHLQD
jgi:tetrahydromethanopterin S-methyltransferase subunit G